MNRAVASLSWDATALLKLRIKTMKKPPIFSFARFREQSRRRRFHAALRRLPVYEIENLALTDAANVLPVNLPGDVKVRPSRLRIHYRWFRLRFNWRQLFLL